MKIHKCCTCGQRVSVDGKTTHYYKGEEAKLTAQEIIEELEKESNCSERCKEDFIKKIEEKYLEEK